VEDTHPFDPTRESVGAMGADVARWVAEHYAALHTLPVVPPVTPAESFALFDQPVPEEGMPWPHLLARFKRDIVANSFHLPSPRYFGLMNPTPLPIAVFAEAMAAALNQNVAAWHHSPAATAVEAQVIRWLCEVCRLPKGAFGSLTSGGTPANTTGLKIALNEKVPEVRERGLFGLAARPVFYASAEAHFSIEKSANILGLGTRDGFRRIPVDGDSRADVEALRAMIAADRKAGLRPFCLVGVAGVTSNGVIDPLAALADVAAEEGLWFHVDAAYGAGGLLSDALRPRFAGIERADSVTVDPHKWWYLPYPCGALLTRDGAAGERTFHAGDVYIPDTGRSVEFRHHGMIGSRAFNALKLWLAMLYVGRRAYGRQAEEQVALAQRFVEELTRDGAWEAVTPVDTAIAAVRYVGKGAKGEGRRAKSEGSGPPDIQDRIVARVMESRRHWISPTTTVGKRAIRVMVISYLTRWEHLEELIAALRDAARDEADE
jgi:aromatic-L-amino-acid decarboxylase